jgi:hypothetical protein
MVFRTCFLSPRKRTQQVSVNLYSRGRLFKSAPSYCLPWGASQRLPRSVQAHFGIIYEYLSYSSKSVTYCPSMIIYKSLSVLHGPNILVVKTLSVKFNLEQLRCLGKETVYSRILAMWVSILNRKRLFQRSRTESPFYVGTLARGEWRMGTLGRHLGSVQYRYRYRFKWCILRTFLDIEVPNMKTLQIFLSIYSTRIYLVLH